MNKDKDKNELYVVGVDIGGTKIIIQVADMQGNVVHSKKVSTTNDFDSIHRFIQESLQTANTSMEQVAAIGFGVPGITNTKDGIIVEAPAFRWSNIPFKSIMQRYFNKPVFVNNDVNCALFGERWKGAAKGVNNCVFIAIGTGVGSAIISNGSLVQGEDFMSGSIAYFVVDHDIRQNKANKFGEFGLFEKKVSGLALGQHGFTAEILFEKYSLQDKGAIQIIDQFTNDLSIGIANISSLLNPKKIIIGGGVSRSLPLIIESIRSSVARITPISTIIQLSELGEEAGAVGAIAYSFEQLGHRIGESNDENGCLSRL